MSDLLFQMSNPDDPASDTAYAVRATEGERHLDSSDVKDWGTITENATFGHFSIGEREVLVGPLQFQISCCTPRRNDIAPNSCNGMGAIAPSSESRMVSNGLPALAVGDKGLCTGFGINASTGVPGVPVVCRMQIGQSCQPSPENRETPLLAATKSTDQASRHSMNRRAPETKTYWAKFSIRIDGRQPDATYDGRLEFLTLFGLVKFAAEFVFDANGIVRSKDGNDAIHIPFAYGEQLKGRAGASELATIRIIRAQSDRQVPSDESIPMGARVDTQLPVRVRIAGRREKSDDGVPTINVHYGKVPPERDVLNLVDHVYVNCGSWTNGHTDFVAVMDDEIILGSWGGRPFGKGFKPLFPKASTPLIKRLFSDQSSTSVTTPQSDQRLHALAGETARLFLQKHYRSFMNLIPKEELWIFVGDCHISGLRGWSCDNFRRGNEFDSSQQSASLAAELNRFLVDMENRVQPTRIVQIGDMYDVWELQGIIESAYEVMEDIFIGYPDSQSQAFHARVKSHKANLERGDDAIHDNWLEGKFPKEQLAHPQVYSDIESREQPKLSGRPPWELTRACLIEYLGLSTTTGSTFARTWLDKVTLPDAMALLQFQRHGHHFAGQPKSNIESDWRLDDIWYEEKGGWTEAATVIPRIQSAYVGLRDLWKRLNARDPKLHVIEGNHDTTAKNAYLDQLFDAGDINARRTNLAKLTWTPRIYEQDPTAHLKLKDNTFVVAGGQLVYEHGDAFDQFNNDEDFYKRSLDELPPRGGYRATKDWVVWELDMPSRNWWAVKSHLEDLWNPVSAVGADWAVRRQLFLPFSDN